MSSFIRIMFEGIEKFGICFQSETGHFFLTIHIASGHEDYDEFYLLSENEKRQIIDAFQPILELGNKCQSKLNEDQLIFRHNVNCSDKLLDYPVWNRLINNDKGIEYKFYSRYKIADYNVLKHFDRKQQNIAMIDRLHAIVVGYELNSDQIFIATPAIHCKQREDTCNDIYSDYFELSEFDFLRFHKKLKFLAEIAHKSREGRNFANLYPDYNPFHTRKGEPWNPIYRIRRDKDPLHTMLMSKKYLRD